MAQQKQQGSTPSAQELRRLAEELINGQSTMTLATARGNTAWVAPVYYVLFRSNFYFFSDTKARHIQESMENAQVSAAIYPSVFLWRDIRGIQMSGRVQPVPAGLEAIQAIRAYLKKFSFAKEFFDSGESLDMVAFEKRFKVKLYKFRRERIYYLDNQIHFGFRAEVKL